MELLDPRSRGSILPPSNGPAWTTVPPEPPSRQEAGRQRVSLFAMIPWTFAAALTMPTMFAATGWQVRRLVGDQTWSDALMWITIVVGIASAICVFGWIWCDAPEALEVPSRSVTIALIAAVSTWTFVNVLNIRMTTGRRRNPLIATLIQLCSTLAVTEACRAMWLACRHEADHHDMLVGRCPTPDALRQVCRPRHETVAGR